MDAQHHEQGRGAAHAVLALALGAVALGIACWVSAAEPAAPTESGEGHVSAPATLEETGLYADFESGAVRPDVLAFTPQYPLWSDGAAKRRWIALPEGEPIDASNPDAWVFPIGTRVWKEFSFGARTETRFMERASDGSWIYATYVWSADGRTATLAPDAGIRAHLKSPRHDIPSVTDCRACHDAGPSPILGFSALQLSADRDPLAPHGEPARAGDVDLEDLIERGLVRGLPANVAQPRIAAATPRERAVLGYLHANCGACHNASGPLASLGMELDSRIARDAANAPGALRTTIDHPSRFHPTGQKDCVRIAPGSPEHSVVVERMSSRFGALQMPPLGTHAVDETALRLISDWIRHDLSAPVSAASAPSPRREFDNHR